jgi:hypothetical protein
MPSGHCTTLARALARAIVAHIVHRLLGAQLDEDQLFYLRSRGLPRAEAEQLLLEAFGL